MPTLLRSLASAGATSALLVSMAACVRTPPSPAPASTTGATTLKDAFAGMFRVGAAVNDRQFTGADTRGAALIKAQFNTVTPENVLKWEHVHPRPDAYDFSQADQYVDFATANGMFVVGHTLVWHSQTPRWVFQHPDGTPLTRDELLARMHDHIATVVGRYRGRVNGWDVVNEALDEDGSLRRSPWRSIIGDDYIAKAFQFAHEADPDAELYYNDYNLEFPAKRQGVVALVKSLQAQGIPITAVGSQTHDKLQFPTPARLDSTIAAVSALGVRVNISELDVDVLPPVTRNRTADVSVRVEQQGGANALNPYVAGLPGSVQQALARRYADLFEVLVKYRRVVDRVTFWGVGDGDSWLNDWPMPGRTSYPLLFDRQDLPKPAFDAVMNVARRARAGSH